MKRRAIPSAGHVPVRSQQALDKLSAQFHAAFARGDFSQALRCATQAWTVTRNPAALGDVALCQMRLGQSQQAYNSFLLAAKQAPSANLYDGLAEAAGQLGKREEVQRFGSLSLALKVQEAALEPPAATRAGWAQQPPPVFDASNPSRNAIAFSLYGGDPRYCETSVLNVRAAKDLFPAWHCRFYVNETVPADVQRRLKEEGATLIDARDLGQPGLPGTLWRFLALDDDSVDRVQFRDADSLLSTRDQAAVLAWCESDKWFHLMRDYHTHTELILAGMWGACRGALCGLASEILAYTASRSFSQRYVDQHFLRHRVWQVASQSLLMHDDWYVLAGNQPFPAHAPMAVDALYAHVGANVGAPSMEVQHVAPNGAVIRWTLVDEQGEAVCSYPATVQENAYRANIPSLYARALASGHWKVITRPIEP